MSANDYQVGGTHYRSEFIHWDFVLSTGMGYLEGNATKYISRAGKKGDALPDLQKALHYVVKLRENAGLCLCRKPHVNQLYLKEEARRFNNANQIKGKLGVILLMLTCWETVGELNFVINSLNTVINDLAKNGKILEDPAPVPLEDSNKHAQRDMDTSPRGAAR